jgi:acetolactate synthase I/II/III large subunit
MRYDQIAAIMGGFGAYIEKISDLKPVLAEAIASGLPAVINVRTDPDSGFAGMDLPWKIN